MNFENLKNVLTMIITNNNFQINNKNVFIYPNVNNNTHSETLDCFINDTNLNLKNANYFDTSLEIAKMGHLVIYNLENTDDLLIFCPDLNDLTPYQQISIQVLTEYIIENEKNVNIALYNKDQDIFSYHDRINIKEQKSKILKKVYA